MVDGQGAPVRRASRCAGVVGAVAAGLLLAACGQAGEEGAADDAGEEAIQRTEEGDIRFDYVGEPADAEPTYGGAVVFALNAETDGWDVTANRWASSAHIVGNALYDPLMAYDPDSIPQPYLAESVEPVEEGVFDEWAITIRPGVTFHDGTPVDAEAVARNLEAHQTSALTSPAVSFFASDGVRVEDDLTVVVEMEKPWSTFPDVLTSQIGYIMAPSMMDDPDGSREPVGSGPFTFVRWVPDAELEVRRNGDYWREGLPYLDQVTFEPIPDVQSRTRTLVSSGSSDIIETQDAGQIQTLAEAASAGELQLYSDDRQESSTTFIGLNVRDLPFSDENARRAIAHAVDREALSEAAYHGLFEPAYGPVQEHSPWYVETDFPRLDLERAREYADAYEAEHGEPLSFTANITPVTEIVNIALTLQGQAERAGIDVELNQLDEASLIGAAITADFEATGFILFGSPMIDREYVFIADVPEGSPLNFTGNRNETIIDALDAARATDDPDEQAEHFATVQHEMANDLNFIFLVHNLNVVAYKNELQGVADWTLPDGSPGGRTTTPVLTEAWLSR